MKYLICPKCKVGLLVPKFFLNTNTVTQCNECLSEIEVNFKYYINEINGGNDNAKKKENN